MHSVAPPKTAPMVAVAAPSTSSSSSTSSGPIVTQQPAVELMPQPDSNPERLNLRGGGMSCGFDCCGGSLRFYKHCC